MANNPRGFFLAFLKALLLLFGCLAIHHFLARSRSPIGSLKSLTRSETRCRNIHKVQDQCAFFRQYCGEEDDGILSYLNLYYCRLAGGKAFAMILILAWLAVLFTTLGLVAGDFFSVNLSTIAHALHLSDNLAGVTFLALGNGSPDIFSTFAAMNSDSSSMAIGELLGAAAFITSVVGGSMALVKPFHVVKVSLIRDILFLIVALIFLICVMVDGFLRLWHCVVMLVFYVVYVATVMSWHWWLSHKAYSKDGAGEGDVQSGGNMHPSSTEETPLLSEAHFEHTGPRARGRIELAYRRRKSGFWQYWADDPPHKIDYRAMSPSICSTLRFRHKESLNREHDAQGLPTSDGHSQIPSEQQQIHSVENQESADSGTKPQRTLRHVFRVLLPSLQDLRTKNIFHRFVNVTIALIVLVVKLTLPVAEEDGNDKEDRQEINGKSEEETSPRDWERWLLIIQLFIAPQFMSVIIWHQISADPSMIVLPALACLGGSAAFALLVLLTSDSNKRPRWYPLISIAGFIISIAWISSVADEMVSILKALGVIWNISEAILGLTVFAVGNSLDDLAANISVAQHRHPIMALSACFGGPLLNILLGISISGLYIFAKTLRTKNQVVGIDLHSSQTLFITAGTVIVILVMTLVMMLWTRWRMTRSVGLVLIAIWLIGTIANLVLKVES